MKTSYFAKYSEDDGISIAIKSPDWFDGPSYSDLFPKWDMINAFKKTRDEDEYVTAYYSEILSKLDPEKVWEDLKDKTLLCWERSGSFCHRRIVADWLENTLGVKVLEVQFWRL